MFLFARSAGDRVRAFLIFRVQHFSGPFVVSRPVSFPGPFFCCCGCFLRTSPTGRRVLSVMDLSGVTDPGSQGSGNTSLGDRDGASEVSGSRDPPEDLAREKGRVAVATRVRDTTSDGS